MRTRTAVVAGVAVAAAVAAAAVAAAMYGSTGGEPVQEDMVADTGMAGDAADTGMAGDAADTGMAGDAADTGMAGDAADTGMAGTGDADRLVVLASFYPVYESAKAVGGDRADVSVLVPGGVEPHDWEPSFGDIQRMQAADVVVVNGIGFESWLEDFEAVNSEALVVDASEGIEGIMRFDKDDDHGDEDDHAREEDDHGDHGDEDDHAREEDDHGDEDDHAREEDDHGDEDDHDDHGHAELTHDPHVWLNPVMAKQQVMNIADGLSQKDPQNADYYRSNAAAYAAELDALDRDIREGLAGCATDFITFHSAFSYFAAEYGLVPHPVVDSIDPHGAPTAKRIGELVDLAGDLGMSVVFFEEGWDDRTARTIASELGADGSVMPISTLELAPAGGPSYTEKMRSNLDRLTAALCTGGEPAQGDAAADTGMAGTGDADRLVVLASFYPVYESAKAVGGDRADVSVLVPGGVEPHDWEPSFGDIQRMQAADVVVVNGIGFESWLEDFEAVNSEALVVDASEGIEGIMRFDKDDDHGDEDDHAREEDDHGDEDDHDDHAREEDDHDDHGDEDDHAREEDDHGDEDDHDDHGHADHGHAELTHDPHVWLNPVMAKQQVMNIADGLSQKDPQNADYYRSNAAAYAAELDALDRDIREGLAGCATDFITFHSAFSYFAAEYGLVPHPVVDSIDPHGAPTAKRIGELVDLAGDLGMSVVFFEEGWDDRTARTIASELGADGSVMPISTLELAPAGGPSYTEKMRSNLDSLTAALCR